MNLMLDSINVRREFCLYCRRDLQENSSNINGQVCNDCHLALEQYNNSYFTKISYNNSQIQKSNENNIITQEYTQDHNNIIPTPRKNFKLLALGSPESKKSELLHTIIHNHFQRSYQNRIGIDIISKNLLVNNREIRLSISDICGEDRFSNIRRTFFTGTQLVLFVCNMTCPKSLDDVVNIWNTEFELYLAIRTNRYRCIKFLLGNNYQASEQISITKEELRTVAMRTGCTGYGICDINGCLIDASFNINTGTIEDIFSFLISQFSFTI